MLGIEVVPAMPAELVIFFPLLVDTSKMKFLQSLLATLKIFISFLLTKS